MVCIALVVIQAERDENTKMCRMQFTRMFSPFVLLIYLRLIRERHATHNRHMFRMK